jgi:hypothetical protein
MSRENTSKPAFVRLTLTEDQRAQVRTSVGVDAEAIELTAHELEERIAPRPTFTDVLVSS